MSDWEHSCCHAWDDATKPCPEHGHECHDVLIRKYTAGYGLPIHNDVGGGYLLLSYCPFCGSIVKNAYDEGVYDSGEFIQSNRAKNDLRGQKWAK